MRKLTMSPGTVLGYKSRFAFYTSHALPIMGKAFDLYLIVCLVCILCLLIMSFLITLCSQYMVGPQGVPGLVNCGF